MTPTTGSSRRAALAAAVAAVLCAAPAVLSAQTATDQPPAGQPPMGGPGMGGRRGGPMGMLLQGITLTDAQRTRVDSLMTASRARMQAMRGMTQGGGSDANPAGPPRPDSATRAARRQEMEAQRTALRNILTPDQQKTFDANVARMRDMMQQRMGGNGGPGRG